MYQVALERRRVYATDDADQQEGKPWRRCWARITPGFLKLYGPFDTASDRDAIPEDAIALGELCAGQIAPPVGIKLLFTGTNAAPFLSETQYYSVPPLLQQTRMLDLRAGTAEAAAEFLDKLLKERDRVLYNQRIHGRRTRTASCPMTRAAQAERKLALSPEPHTRQISHAVMASNGAKKGIWPVPMRLDHGVEDLTPRSQKSPRANSPRNKSPRPLRDAQKGDSPPSTARSIANSKNVYKAAPKLEPMPQTLGPRTVQLLRGMLFEALVSMCEAGGASALLLPEHQESPGASPAGGRFGAQGLAADSMNVGVSLTHFRDLRESSQS
jgi:hypothetical protein